MTSGRMFWATFFLCIGVLGLIQNFTSIDLGLWPAWNYWPLVLVLIGLAVLLKDKNTKWIVMGATGGIAGLLLFSLFAGGVRTARTFLDQPHHITTQNLMMDYDGVPDARFRFSSGAGDFTISDTTSAFVAAQAETNMGTYSLRTDGSDSLRSIDLDLDGGNDFWGFGNLKNKVFVRLNPRPAWTIDVEIGAASADIDLSPFLTPTVRVEAGATSLRLTLGDRADSNYTRIEAGAASITLRVPKTADCIVDIDAPMSSKSFEGFKRMQDGIYHSENYGSSKKKIHLAIDAGVSSVQIERY